MTELPQRITSILNTLNDGDRAAIQAVLPGVYKELRGMAQRQLGTERRNHTLLPTDLVHEAWIRLSSSSTPIWNDRTHFFRAAGRVMRFILVDNARRRDRKKHGNARQLLQLDEAILAYEERAVDLVALDEALIRLEEIAPRQMAIIELRFFAGLTNEEAANALGISERTAYEEWRAARAWLFRAIGTS